jgi:broad specificity phosphatase PhoE
LKSSSITRTFNRCELMEQREKHFGECQGLLLKDIPKLYPDVATKIMYGKSDVTYCFPGGGESIKGAYDRVTGAICRIAAENMGKKIVLVSHGGCIDVMYRFVKGIPMNSKSSYPTGNCSVTHLRARTVTHHGEDCGDGARGEGEEWVTTGKLKWSCLSFGVTDHIAAEKQIPQSRNSDNIFASAPALGEEKEEDKL